MPNYKSSGEENLRADAHVYAGETTSTPAGTGKDAGGTGSNYKVLSSAGKSSGGGSSGTPRGVQSFSDESV